MRTSPFRTNVRAVPALKAESLAVDRAREVTVGAYREEDETAVIALLTSAFGRWPTSLDVEPRAFFRWKHEASPFGASVRFVARVDGEVAGFLAYMPWRLSFAGQVRETFRGVDIAVAPRFQRLGVARALIVEARNSYRGGIAMTWSNPNEQSRSGVLKTGRKRVDVVSRYIGPGGAGLGTVKRLLPTGSDSPADEEDESLATTLSDESLLGRVLSGRAPSGRIEKAWDAGFLRWRYGRQGNYRAVASDHPEAGAGIAIFRTKSRGRFSVASVCEVLTERDDERIVQDLVRKVRDSAQTDFLACAFASSRVARHCGLVPSGRAVMIAANPLHEDLSPDPTQASAWELSLGDLELI